MNNNLFFLSSFLHRKNFIAVDVFFAQLKYMEIIQEPASKIEDFFGELFLILLISSFSIFLKINL